MDLKKLKTGIPEKRLNIKKHSKLGLDIPNANMPIIYLWKSTAPNVQSVLYWPVERPRGDGTGNWFWALSWLGTRSPRHPRPAPLVSDTTINRFQGHRIWYKNKYYLNAKLQIVPTWTVLIDNQCTSFTLLFYFFITQTIKPFTVLHRGHPIYSQAIKFCFIIQPISIIVRSLSRIIDRHAAIWDSDNFGKETQG